MPRPRSIRAALGAAWADPNGAPRTQPILVASICSGVLGYTLASALDLNLLVAYVLTVLGVFIVTTVVLIRRSPGA